MDLSKILIGRTPPYDMSVVIEIPAGGKGPSNTNSTRRWAHSSSSRAHDRSRRLRTYVSQPNLLAYDDLMRLHKAEEVGISFGPGDTSALEDAARGRESLRKSFSQMKPEKSLRSPEGRKVSQANVFHEKGPLILVAAHFFGKASRENG